MPQSPGLDLLRRPMLPPEPTDDDKVDIVGEGDDFLSDASDMDDPEDRKPRRTRYDCGFLLETLWRSRNKSGSANIWIPETIVFKNNSPTHWYFTRPQDGRIMKRNLGQEQFITPKKILEVLGGATGEIAAIFVNFKEVDGKRVATTMQYFDRQTLRDFLYINDPTRNGILQKFLSIRQQKYASASVTNQTLHTLHVTWKKGALRSTKVVQRSHFLRIVEARAGYREDDQDDSRTRTQSYQYATADPLPYGQITLPLQSHLSRKIRQACEKIAEHVRLVTDNAVRITRMMGYFKVGHKGQLWFNFPSSVDVEDWGVAHSIEIPVNVTSHQYTGHHRAVTARREETGVVSETGVRNGTNPHAIIAQNKTEQGFAMSNVKMTIITCPMCENSIESMKSCSLTRHDIIMILADFNTQHNSKVGKLTLQEKASQMWHEMQLAESDELTLPELRWRMKRLSLSHEMVENIETGIALADTDICGVINYWLWNRGVAFAGEKPPPSTDRSLNEPSWSPSRTTRSLESISPASSIGQGQPLDDSTQQLLDVIMSGSQDLETTSEMIRSAAARGKRQSDTVPQFVVHLRSGLPQKLYARMTTPGAIEREAPEFLNKNVEVCSSCYKSVKMCLAKRSTMEWDSHLETLLHPVSISSLQSSPSGRPAFRRPTPLVDRMWSRMEMSKSAKFPPLQPPGHTPSKVIRANQNDLAWSKRSKLSTASPRSPSGKKSWEMSPRSRAAFARNWNASASESNGSWRELDARRDDSVLLVQTSTAVKLLHEVSDEELRRELERREIAALTARESSQGAYFQVENNADDEMMSAPATVDKTSSSLIPVDSTPSPSDSVSVSIGAASQHEAAAPPKEEVKPDSLADSNQPHYLHESLSVSNHAAPQNEAAAPPKEMKVDPLELQKPVPRQLVRRASPPQRSRASPGSPRALGSETSPRGSQRRTSLSPNAIRMREEYSLRQKDRRTSLLGDSSEGISLGEDHSYRQASAIKEESNAPASEPKPSGKPLKTRKKSVADEVLQMAGLAESDSD